ncbi:LicD family protein [Candidatus Mycoplasma mahonii]|uniref:LicD family protein n=1 Tax=Candidatus Mycoplasma mahonii TaxID=3004105 RepID=UPI0026ECEF54|nr:LicD family protein [Candidatus Mycoplasma mahonii]WKX02418.1 LicD family protein [Candidatus Mycoplasma mahonii]
MEMNKTKILNLIKEFIEICGKEKVWFSAGKSSILGMVRHGGFIPWNNKFEVIIKPDGYKKLMRLYPDNIVDSSTNRKYKKLQSAWVRNNKNIDEKQPFIEIVLLVPTTLKKIKHYRSINSMIYNFLTFRRDNIKHAIDDLHVRKHEGFFIINSRRSSVVKYWIHNITFETVNLKLLEILIPVFKEYKTLLVNWYGDDYLQTTIPSKYIEYISPTRHEKVIL